MTKLNKIKSMEDFRKYNIICTTTEDVKKCLKMLDSQQDTNNIKKGERIVSYLKSINSFWSETYAYSNNNISYYDFKKIYNRLKKQQEQEPKTLVEFMKKEPTDVIIENEIDYSNIVNYLNKKGIIWQGSLKDYQSLLCCYEIGLTFYGENNSLSNELLCKIINEGRKSITVKELFKKFNLEYKELPDFEADENGRIIKINNYNSDKRIYYFTTFNMELIDNLAVKTVNKEKVNESIELGVIFDSREAVNNYQKYLSIHTKLKNLAYRLNNGEKIDWSNENQYKYCIYYYLSEDQILYYRLYNYIDNNIFCLDENFKNEAIKEIGEDDLRWYLQRTY